MRSENPSTESESVNSVDTRAIAAVVAMFLCYWYGRYGGIGRMDDHDRDDLHGQDHRPKRQS